MWELNGDFFLGNGVYELKMDFGPGYRLYFGRESDIAIILLCGGVKKSQQKDIEKAWGRGGVGSLKEGLGAWFVGFLGDGLGLDPHPSEMG